MFTQVEEADKTRLAAAEKTKQYRWRSHRRASSASALYPSLPQPPGQKLPPGPALLLQRLVKLYLACRRNRCTGPAPTISLGHLPPSLFSPPATPGRPTPLCFHSARPFLPHPRMGFPWPRPPFPIRRIARVQHAFLNPTLATSTRPTSSSSFSPPGLFRPPAASPRPCPFLGVIQPRPQPHGGDQLAPGLKKTLN